MTSVRLFIGRWSEGRERVAEKVAEMLRHIVIEAEPDDDCCLALQLTIGADAHAIGSEGDDVEGAEVAVTDDPVNHVFSAIGKVDQQTLIAHYNQLPQSSMMQGYQQSYEHLASRQKESSEAA